MIFKRSLNVFSKHTFAIFHPKYPSMTVVNNKAINSGNAVVLTSNEHDEIFRRLQKVLRCKRGDQVVFFTGSEADPRLSTGGELAIRSAKFEVVEFIRNACLLTPMPSDPEEYERCATKFNVTLCLGMLSKREAWEEQLYACAQAGIHQIQPIIPSNESIDRSVVKNYSNEERIQKVIISAIEQSKQLGRFPIIHSPKTIEQIVASSQSSKIYTRKYYFSAGGSIRFLEMLNELDELDNNENVMIMIGPEQDWREDEINLFRKHGFTSVSITQSTIFRSQDCTQVVTGCLTDVMTNYSEE